MTGPLQRQACRFLDWLNDPWGRREERAASTLVAFFMFFPLVVGAFGFGIDLARNVWIRNSIQNAVDSAVVGGAGVTKITSAGVVVINPVPAVAEMRKLYAINRADNPNLKCIGDNAGFAANGITYHRCWRELPAPRVTSKTAQFNVQEQSRNAFMGLLGMPTQSYTLQGKAKVNRSTE
ncbi:TadE/TadG family type IV pilus assembly protein [Tessaracoccus sp.]